MVANSRQNGSSALDEVNRRLLTELHREPRISMSELARRVGFGRSPAPVESAEPPRASRRRKAMKAEPLEA